MARREIESQGKDVATAIIKGLNELGRRRDQVEVSVVQEEKAGFLGIGGRPAVVKIIEKKWDSENCTPMKPRVPRNERVYAKKSEKSERPEKGEKTDIGEQKDKSRKPKKDFKQRGFKNNKKGRQERFSAPKIPKENEPQKLPSLEIQNAVIPDNIKAPMQEAKETLAKILEYMGVKTENLNVWWDATQERILITFDCDHPAVVIGKEGKTLESVQYIITLVISRHFDKPISVITDTQNYWRRLEDKINEEVDRAVAMVKRTKRDYRFRPMSAQIRRYVHRYVVNNEAVETVSEGEGKWRKVVLKTAGKKDAKGGPKEKITLTPIAEEHQTAEQPKPALAGEGAPVEITEAEKQTPQVDLTPIENFEVPAQQAASSDAAQEAQPQEAKPEAAAQAEEAKTETAAKAEDIPVETHTGSRASTLENASKEAQKDSKSVMCADNAGQNCVLTSESTNCKDVANVTDPEQVKIVHDAIHAPVPEAAPNADAAKDQQGN